MKTCEISWKSSWRMKKVRLLIAPTAVFLLLCFGLSAHAARVDSVPPPHPNVGMGEAASLEERLTPLARGFDPDSLIYVTMSQSDKQPSAQAVKGDGNDTPFSLNQPQAPKPNPGSTAHVTIYLRRFDRRSEIKSLVEKILKEKGITHEVLISRLPETFTLEKERSKASVDENKDALQKDAEKNPRPTVPVQDEKFFSELFPKQANEFFDSGSAFFKSDFPRSEKSANEFIAWLRNSVLLGSIFVMVLSTIFVVLNVILWFQGQKMLRAHVTLLVQALKEGELGQNVNSGIARQPSRIEAQRSLSDGKAISASNANAQFGREFPPNGAGMPQDILDDGGLAALLRDCYWCQEDGYAVFLWRRLSGERRARLIKGDLSLKEYLASCRENKAVNLDFEDDPYYLEPLPIEHLSLDSLCELVRAEPSLYAALPRMRQRALPLTFAERFSFSQSSVVLVRRTAEQLCRAHPDSPKRVIASHFDVQIKSERDELEILPLIGELPIQFALSSPSLVWIRRVDKQSVAKILTRFNARELASAWSAPEEILKEMLELLSAEKRELLTEHLKRIPADRFGLTYRSLCDEILASIEGTAVVIAADSGNPSTGGAASAA